MEHNCGFINDKKAFRYRAAAIIVEKGCVLFARNDEDDYFYSCLLYTSDAADE